MFSVILLAVVDVKCKLIIVDIGSFSKKGDGEIFANTKPVEYFKKLQGVSSGAEPPAHILWHPMSL
jgi:hypothetical protein